MESVPASTSSASSVASADGRTGAGGSDYLNMGMFAQSGGVSDLLLGGSGLGTTGTYANETGSVGSAGATSSGTSAFDINDFPSLGGATGGGSTNTNNGLAAALRQQQQLLAHQQMLQGGAANSKSSNLYRLAMSSGANGGANFNMATEDFPALPGAPVGGGATSTTNGAVSGPTNSPLMLGVNENIGASSGNTAFSSTTSRSGLYGSQMDGGGGSSGSSNPLETAGGGSTGLAGGGGGGSSGALGGLGGLTSTSNPSSAAVGQQRSSTPLAATSGNVASSGTAPTSASSGVGSAVSGDFGLLGLLSVIRLTDSDRQALAMGSDLNVLGLNMNSNDQLYSTFASPWTDKQASKEPQYQLPMCYYMQPPALKTGHLSKFQLETLFYIFYALTKDVLQAYAAQELYSREWRYNGDLKLWFKLAGPADGVSSSSSGAAQYLYFDINSWERRLFNGNIQNITSGFLSEEDVRVKFPNS